MKNHLSMEGSMGAAASSSFCLRGGSCSGETRVGEWLTVRLVLRVLSVEDALLWERGTESKTYVAMPPGAVLPVMSFSQASAHSWMTSMA